MPKFDVNIEIEASSFFLYTGEDAIEADSESSAATIAKERALDEFRGGNFEIDRSVITAIEKQADA